MLVDGWLRTGDVVERHEGQYRIVDRLKDIMITAGGKNLTPSEIENTMKASPYIKECVVVAESRRFVSALIQIDFETVSAVGAGARRHVHAFPLAGRTAGGRRAGRRPRSTRGNASLAQVSQIRKFHLLAKELDHDDGEVTATMKVRRRSVYEAYAAEIETMYG